MKYALGEHRVQTDGDHYWIAPNASVIGQVTLGRNVSVWFNAVIRADHAPITIGENSNIQDGSVLHVDPDMPLTVGRNVTVGHMVTLHSCEIGDDTLIGIGAVVLNGARIGRNCLIGAKALIPEGKDIPDNSLVVGAPGRVIRQVSDANEELITWSFEVYLDDTELFRNQLKPDGE